MAGFRGARSSAQRDLHYKRFLAEALAVEWCGRDQRGIEARLRQSRLPWLKTLDQYDFSFQPSLDRRQVRELAGLSFVERGQNIVILGPVSRPAYFWFMHTFDDGEKKKRGFVHAIEWTPSRHA